MKNIITFVGLICILFSCDGEGKNKPPKPENLISKEKMVDVIYDMSLLSAAKGINRKVMEQKGVRPEAYVFKKHSIDSLQFAESNAYYSYDIDTYEGIYLEVKNRLEKDKKHYNDLVHTEAVKSDSIAKERRKMRDSLKKNRPLIGDKLEGAKLGDKKDIKLKSPSPLKKADSLKQ